jgi:hypothetical protein
MSGTDTGPSGGDDDVTITNRSGGYRGELIEREGATCENCGWSPMSMEEERLLHAHHRKYVSHGGGDELSNLRLLCRDCHINLHHDSVLDVVFVRKLARVMGDWMDHKKDGFEDRVFRRVVGDTVLSDGSGDTRKYLVEGIMSGDGYDAYYVIPDEDRYLRMCSCYAHKFGTRRAVNCCTHVGAAICGRAIEVRPKMDDDKLLKEVKRKSKQVNKRARRYVQRRQSLKDKVEEIRDETGYKDSHLRKGRAQALWMVGNSPEWDCYGGKEDGNTVIVGRNGYTCSEHGNDPPPCGAVVGAYLLRRVNG